MLIIIQLYEIKPSLPYCHCSFFLLFYNLYITRLNLNIFSLTENIFALNYCKKYFYLSRCGDVQARADLASLLTVKCRGLAPGRVLAGLARSHRQSRHRGCGWRGRALPVHNTPAEPATQLCGHSNLWPQTNADNEISRSFHNLRGRLQPGPSP